MECLKVYDKIKSNYFQNSHGTAELFCAASLLNHSCCPNAESYSLDAFKAVKNIPAGDQVFVDYNVADAKVDLPELYGFNCRCPRCLGQAC